MGNHSSPKKEEEKIVETSDDKKCFQMKITIIGYDFSGKSSLSKCFAKRKNYVFEKEYNKTIGAQFFASILRIEGDKNYFATILGIIFFFLLKRSFA